MVEAGNSKILEESSNLSLTTIFKEKHMKDAWEDYISTERMIGGSSCGDKETDC